MGGLGRGGGRTVPLQPEGKPLHRVILKNLLIIFYTVLFCSSSLWNLKLQSSRNTNVYSRIIEICFSFITGINFIPLFKCDFLCGFVYINPSNSCRTISTVSTVNPTVLHMYFFLLHTGLIINISRIYSFNACIITQRYVTDL